MDAAPDMAGRNSSNGVDATAGGGHCHHRLPWLMVAPSIALRGSSAAGGPNGRQPVFVSDRVKVAAEAEARLRAMNMMRDVVSMWETSTDSDTRPW